MKPWGDDGPDLRMRARSETRRKRRGAKIIGETIRGASVSFRARVLNLDRARAARPGAYALLVIRDGEPFEAAPIPPDADKFRYRFRSDDPGRYRLQVQRTASGLASVEAVSTPIWHERRRR